MAVFAVTLGKGPDWDPSLPRRRQPGWTEHADYMDRLVDEGYVVLGGPIGEGDDVLLAVEAADESGVRAVLERDPWIPAGVLRIGRIRAWTVWLDARRRPVPLTADPAAGPC
jgi:uncharacterized protein YciI